MILLPLSLLLVSFGTMAIAKQLPSFVQRCKLDDPLVEKCVAKQVETFLPHLIEGVPGLKLPKIEPLRISKLSRESGMLNATYKDLAVYGVKDIKVKRVSFDFSVPELELQIHYPRLEIWSTYELLGKLLTFQLSSTGSSSMNATNLNANFHITGNFSMKKERKYINFVDASTNVTMNSVQLYLSNLFNGNPALTEATNRILNENIEAIYPEMLPIIENAISSLTLSNVKGIFSEFTLEELFV